MKIIFVRHGETDWNAMSKYQGHRDVGLNRQGREDAERLAAYMANEPVEAVYSSDLSRARETAEIIARTLKLEVTSEQRLRELSFGEWEGRTFSEVYRDYRDQFQQWFENTLEFQLPGGESFAQVLDRVEQAIFDISQRHKGTVLMVSHGGVIRAFLYKLKAISHEEMWGTGFQPGSLVKLSIEEDEVKVLDLIRPGG